MSNVSPFEQTSSVEDEASEWLVQLDADDVPHDVQARFAEWLSGHPDRQLAFDRLKRDWLALDDLAQLRPAGPADPDVTRRWLGAEAAPPHAGRDWHSMALAATALAATVVLAIMPTAEPPRTYTTDVGERRSVTLADASRVELNTDSELVVDFSDDERRLRLVRGEAFFEVAHDTSRPFIVSSDGTAVRAVGTAFNVRVQDDGVAVTVTQGKVEVARRRHPLLAGLLAPAPPIALGAGGHAELEGRQAAVAALTPDAVARDLAWRRGMLAFKGESLEAVVAEIGRYTDTEIAFADDDIRDLKVGGYFRADDVDAVLDTVAKVFPVRVERTDGKVILHKTNG